MAMPISSGEASRQRPPRARVSLIIRALRRRKYSAIQAAISAGRRCSREAWKRNFGTLKPSRRNRLSGASVAAWLEQYRKGDASHGENRPGITFK